MDADTRADIMIGFDPASGKCQFWQFGSDGCVTIFEVTQVNKDVWMLKGVGRGPNGETRYRSKVTRTGPDSTREEMLEYVLNGTAQATTVRIWNRTRD